MILKVVWMEMEQILKMKVDFEFRSCVQFGHLPYKGTYGRC